MDSNTQNDIRYSIVATTQSATGDGTLIDSYADLNDGEVALVDERSYTIENGSPDMDTEDYVRFIKRDGTKLIPYPWFKVGKILSVNAETYSAPSEQITYVGYNGTTGNIDAENDTSYSGRIRFIDGFTPGGHEQEILFDYDSDSSGIASEIAIGLTNSIRKNENMFVEDAIDVTAVMDEAHGDNATGGFGSAVTLVEGTKTFTASGGTYTTDGGTSTALSAGDFVRFAASATATATTTDSVYRIENVNGTTVTLDRPVAEPGGTYGAVQTDVYSAAVGQAANWGVKITGVPRDVDPAYAPYFKNRFLLSLSNFGTTPVTKTDADEGAGYGAAVAEEEYTSQFNLGNIQKNDSRRWKDISSATETAGYDTISIGVENDKNDTSIAPSGVQKTEFYLAFERSGDYGTLGTGASHMAANFDTLDDFSVSFS